MLNEKNFSVPNSKRIFMSVSEVCEELGVSEAYAYRLMREMNDELKAAGFYTIQGRVDRKFFHEKFYGTSQQVERGTQNASV